MMLSQPTTGKVTNTHKRLELFFQIAVVESICSLLAIFIIPKEAGGTGPFGFTMERLALVMGVIVLIVGLVLAWVVVSSNAPLATNLKNRVKRLKSSVNFTSWIQSLQLAALFGCAYLVLLWIFGPEKFYTPFLARLMPLIGLGAILGLESILWFPPKLEPSTLVEPGILVIALALSRWFQVLEGEEGSHLILFTPILIILTIVTAGAFIQYVHPKTRALSFGVYFALLLVFGIHYYSTARDYSPVNRETSRFDQSAYMDFTRRVYESNFNYTGERNRMPAYPFLQALFYNPNQGEIAFFQQGKQVNIVLSLILLLFLHLIFMRIFPLQQASGLTLIIAFSLFLFKAAFFQAEILYYYLSFIVFLLMGLMLITPTIILSIGTGLALALAYLTKASALPAIPLFLSVYIAKMFVELYPSVKKQNLNSSVKKASVLQIASLSLVIGTFLVVVFPYISESKRNYTQYFYNVNSTFYFWNDSWEEATQETKAHGDRKGWPDLPPDQIPSLQRYLKTHNAADIIERFESGLSRVSNTIFQPYGFANYLLLSFAFLIVIALLYKENTQVLAKRYFYPLLFTIAYFVIYLTLTSWYIIIPTNGARFVYNLFLPFIFVTFFGLQKLSIIAFPKRVGTLVIKPVTVQFIWSATLFFLLAFDIFSIVPGRMVTDAFGW